MALSRDGFTVSEDDCAVEICLVKNMDTAETLTVNVFISEAPSDTNAATGKLYVLFSLANLHL